MVKSLFKQMFWVMLVLCVACKEKYIPPVITNDNTKFLVVEGYITVGNQPTTITLSHTINLNASPEVVPVSGALITVESDDGSSYPLNEVGSGVYTIAAINGSTSAKYRLSIAAASGKQYTSDYVVFKQAPPIDSLSWQQQDDGVHVYANAHDATGNTKYYGWDFEETYEYHAPYHTYFKVVNGVIQDRFPDEQIFQCWHSLNSTGILVASTTKLTSDVVYQQPLQFIPTASVKLGQIYSILVNQHALTLEGLDYWQQISKNTEHLGSLFDAQPSQVQGNIHCVNDASETVIGFVSASSVEQKRLFIYHSSLLDWQFPIPASQICDTVHLNTSNQALLFAQGYLPVNYYAAFSIFGSTRQCADCTTEGGTTTKPPFWP